MSKICKNCWWITENQLLKYCKKCTYENSQNNKKQLSLAKKVKPKICKVCWKEFYWIWKFCKKWCEKEFEKEKKAKVREKKKLSISSLTKKADTLWSLKVKDIWGNKCAYCWKTEYLNSHHLFTRSRKSTRWDLNNWICLCSWCHTLSSEFSAHQTSLEFFLWLEEKFWREWIEIRKNKSIEIIKVTPDYIQTQIEILENN